MGVHLHRATRTDLLAQELAAHLAVPAADPFAQSLVVVPARGVERWLTQRLSHRLGARVGAQDGICAGVRFVSPNSLVTLLLGTDRDDPWLPDRLAWPLLQTIEESADEPWADTLARHLGLRPSGDTGPEAREMVTWRQGRRYSVARRLAGIFHSYAVQRPGLLDDWESDTPGDGRPWGDGAGGDLPPDLAWQPPLWRALTRRMGGPTPTERHRITVGRLRAGDPALTLPATVSFFGHTRLARTEMDLIAALGSTHEVHLWLPHPSPALWAGLRDTARGVAMPRREDSSVLSVSHPLLASLGRDVRELQAGLLPLLATDTDLTGADAPVAERTALAPGGPGVAGPDPRGGTVTGRSWLHHLQADLRADRVPTQAEAAARAIAATDRSIQVHACHGPTRQVEVLREALLAALDDDPTLEPRDVLVMCPDIELYAPLIHGAFGLADISFGAPAHPGHQLRVQLADRALTATNPLLEVAEHLLALAGGRLGAGEVLDLADRPPVRRRFAFDEDDLDRIRGWVEAGAIRWGIDKAHRSDYGLAAVTGNTWRFGLDRLLVGVTHAEHDPQVVAGPQTAGVDCPISAGVLPLDDVDSATIDLVGRFCEFIDRLDAFRTLTLSAAGAAQWASALSDAVTALTEVPLADMWQHAELERELDLVARDGGSLALTLNDMRTLMAAKVGSRPTRANFRTGALTVCSLVPMRSVPHRVVAILGLDDGVFPRNSVADGDDALARCPLTGERDPRSEDRQLLLDAVCAAGETLIVTYTGADPQTGAPRPPAVPLGELIDAARITAGLDLAAGEAGPVPPVRRHPLQPFDLRAVAAHGPAPDNFDPRAREVAAAFWAGRAPQSTPPGLPGSPLPPAPAGDLTLTQLSDFLANPGRAFLRQRLDIGDPSDEDTPVDTMPISLGEGLETWQLGDRLVRAMRAGGSVEMIQSVERLRGLLPPDRLGNDLLAEVGPIAQAIVERTESLIPPGSPRAKDSVDIEVDLGGRRLTGTIPSAGSGQVVFATYSALGARQLLAAWVHLLALTAGTPAAQGPWRVHTVGRHGRTAAASTFGPIDPALARTLLGRLVALHDLGMRHPIPFAPKTSHAYAQVLQRSRHKREFPALVAARSKWSPDKFAGENADSSIARVFGMPSPPFEALLAVAWPEQTWPGPAETAAAIGSSFGHVAMEVFAPILTAEQGG